MENNNKKNLKLVSILKKFKKFAFLRKVAFLLMVLSYFKAMYVIVPDFIEIVLKFLAFFFLYNIIYFANDLIDYEFDKNRRFIRESKILARNEVSIREFSILGFKIASFGLLIGAMVFSKIEWFLIALLVIIGIYRSYIRNLVLRSVTIFLMEYLNLLLFATFIAQIEILLRDIVFHLFAICISVWYTILYYAYRKIETVDINSLKAYFIIANLVIIIYLVVLPLHLAAYIIFGHIIASIYWWRSLLKKSEDMITKNLYIVLIPYIIALYFL